MKLIAVLAMIAAPTFLSAQQRPAYVADFNGHFLQISMSTLDKVPNFEPADLKAADICATVGKSPELQNREKVTPNRFMLFYVCR